MIAYIIDRKIFVTKPIELYILYATEIFPRKEEGGFEAGDLAGVYLGCPKDVISQKTLA